MTGNPVIAEISRTKPSTENVCNKNGNWRRNMTTNNLNKWPWPKEVSNDSEKVYIRFSSSRT